MENGPEEYRKLEARSLEERVEIVRKWSRWFYAHTSTFEGKLGMQLAYLWPSILNASQIECDPDSPVVTLLRENNVPEDEVIWDYILDFPEEEEEEDATE